MSMTIMNTHRHIYHWKDEKNLLEKLFSGWGKIPPWGKTFEKLQFYEKCRFDANLDSGRKIRRI